MDRKAVFLAREIASNAGYDPDQLVVSIDSERDFDLLQIGLAPVSIPSIYPLFMKFYEEAKTKIAKDTATKKGSGVSAPDEDNEQIRNAGWEIHAQKPGKTGDGQLHLFDR